LPNRALRFEREEDGFTADYRVVLSFLQGEEDVQRIEREERVRVGSFAETSRAEESVVFQTLAALAPGRYTVHVGIRDVRSGRGFETTDTLDVPAYGSGGQRASAAVVYRAEGRPSFEAQPELILNPRRTVPFGADDPLVYVEGYDLPPTGSVSLRLLDEHDREVWRGDAALGGDGSVQHALVEIPSGSLPMGRLWLELEVPGADGSRPRSPLLVTLSDDWMVENFEQVLRYLSYIAYPAELDSLRRAQGPERRAVWDRFWERRDPAPASPVNEFREEFFNRVRVATEQLAESGTEGWRTDRGRVYIVLGPPDHIIERQVGRDAVRPNVYEWIYSRTPAGRLELLFVDRTGFGRYELTRQSESAFRSAAARMRPRPR
jgi:GWxTD domain-containing protein